MNIDVVFLDPAAIRFFVSKASLDRLVLVKTARIQIDEEHLARAERTLFGHIFRSNIQHARFRSEHHEVVL